jgi:hypothetical protein
MNVDEAFGVSPQASPKEKPQAKHIFPIKICGCRILFP